MRKREERFAWQTLTPVQKQHVIKLCRQRYRRKIAKKNNKPAEIEEVENNPQDSLF
ncbi:Fe-S protein [Vibrio ishigakensis]|nr:Fe-S protein [Vibrio ishigakensis]GAM68314.1 predicted Fe-S protein [Vibrio sp. JCM 19236]